jgi:hypothetical protein
MIELETKSDQAFRGIAFTHYLQMFSKCAPNDQILFLQTLQIAHKFWFKTALHGSIYTADSDMAIL